MARWMRVRCSSASSKNTSVMGFFFWLYMAKISSKVAWVGARSRWGGGQSRGAVVIKARARGAGSAMVFMDG